MKPESPTNFTGKWQTGGVVHFSWDPPTDTSNITGYKLLDKDGQVIATVPVGTTSHDATGLKTGIEYTFGLVSYNDQEQSDILSLILLYNEPDHIPAESNPPNKGNTMDATTYLPPAPPQPTDIQVNSPSSSNSSNFNQQQGVSPQTLGSSSTEGASVSPQSAAVVDPQSIQSAVKGESLQQIQVHNGGISFWWVMAIAALIVISLATYQRFARERAKD